MRLRQHVLATLGGVERAGVWRRLQETLLAELRRRGRLDQRWTVVDSGSVRAMRGEKNWTEPNRSP